MKETQPLNTLEKEERYNNEKRDLLERSDREIGIIRNKEKHGIISSQQAERDLISAEINLRTAMNNLNRRYYPNTRRLNIDFKKTKTESQAIKNMPKPKNSKNATILSDESPEAKEKVIRAYIKLLKRQLGDNK